MQYDVVIATRNRPDVLRLSIPTHLGQSRPPGALIVVDSSDDHGPVRESFEAATAGVTDVRVECIHEPQPSSSRQRNIGLERVDSPCVMFPDDDSIWFDGTAEAVMAVYERDEDGVIGGVTMRQMQTPPPGILDSQQGQDQRSVKEKLVYRLSPIRARLENLITPNPMARIGRELMDSHPCPSWLDQLNATPVGSMHGYRMTFRTDALRAAGGFDTNLSAYALYEDYDASFRVAADYLLVRTDDAQVYHHRKPGTRAAGLMTGVILILNMAYVTCRNSEPGSKPRRMIRPYARTRCVQYQLRSRSEFGRQRLEGARRAFAWLDDMIAAPRDEQPSLYEKVLKSCLES